MNSFYGGLPGKSFELAKIFNNGAEMEDDLLKKWKSPIGFGEFVLISYGFPAEAPDYLKWTLEIGDKPSTGIRYKDEEGNYPIIPVQEITADNIDTYKDNAFVYGNQYFKNQLIDTNRAFDKYNYNSTFWQKICYTKKEDAFTVVTVAEGENPSDKGYYELDTDTGIYSLTTDTEPVSGKTYYKMTDSENRYIHVVQVNEDTLIAYKLLATMTGTTPTISTLDFDCFPNTQTKTYMILDGDDVDGEKIKEMRKGLLDPSALSNIELRNASIDTPILVVKKPRAAKFFYGDELGVAGQETFVLNKEIVDVYEKTQSYVHYDQIQGKYIEAIEDRIVDRLYYYSFNVAGMGINDFYVNKQTGYIYQVVDEQDGYWILTYQGCFKWVPDAEAIEQARYADNHGSLTELIQPEVITETVTKDGITYDKGKIKFYFRKDPTINTTAKTLNVGADATVEIQTTPNDSVLNLLFGIPRGEPGPGVFKIIGKYSNSNNLEPSSSQLTTNLEAEFGSQIQPADGQFIAVDYNNNNKTYSYLFYKTVDKEWKYILITGIDGIVINEKTNTDYGEGTNYVYSKQYLNSLVQIKELQLSDSLDEYGGDMYWEQTPLTEDWEKDYGTSKVCILSDIKSKKPLIISCDTVAYPEYAMISHAFLEFDETNKKGSLYLYTFSPLEPCENPKKIPLTIIELP